MLLLPIGFQRRFFSLERSVALLDMLAPPLLPCCFLLPLSRFPPEAPFLEMAFERFVLDVPVEPPSPVISLPEGRPPLERFVMPFRLAEMLPAVPGLLPLRLVVGEKLPPPPPPFLLSVPGPARRADRFDFETAFEDFFLPERKPKGRSPLERAEPSGKRPPTGPAPLPPSLPPPFLPFDLWRRAIASRARQSRQQRRQRRRRRIPATIRPMVTGLSVGRKRGKDHFLVSKTQISLEALLLLALSSRPLALPLH